MGLGDFLSGAAEAVGGSLEQAAIKTVKGFQRAGDNFSDARKDVSEGDFGGAAVNAVQGVSGTALSSSGLIARGSLLSDQGSGIAGPAADAAGRMGDSTEAALRSAGINDPISTRAANWFGGGMGQWIGNSVEKNAVSVGDLAANSDQISNLATGAVESAVRDPRAAAGVVGSAAATGAGWVASHPRESAKYAFRELTDPVGLALTAATGGGTSLATKAAQGLSPMSRVAAREVAEGAASAVGREATEATATAVGREVAESAGTATGREAARRTSGLGRLVDEVAYPSGTTMVDKAAQYTTSGGLRNRLFRGSPSASGPFRSRWETALTDKVASQAGDSTLKATARDIAANALNTGGSKVFSESAQNMRRLSTLQRVYHTAKAVNAVEGQYVDFKDDPNAYLSKGVDAAKDRAGTLAGEHPDVANGITAALENTVGDADISNTRLALGAAGLGAAVGAKSLLGAVVGGGDGGSKGESGDVGSGPSMVTAGGGTRNAERVGYSTSAYSSGRGYSGGSAPQSSLQSVGSGGSVRDPYAGGGLTQQVGGGVRDPYRQKGQPKPVSSLYEVRDPYRLAPLKQPASS